MAAYNAQQQQNPAVELQPQDVPTTTKFGPAAWNTTPPSKQRLDKIWDGFVDGVKNQIENAAKVIVYDVFKSLVIWACPWLAPVVAFFDMITALFRDSTKDISTTIKDWFGIPGDTPKIATIGKP